MNYCGTIYTIPNDYATEMVNVMGIRLLTTENSKTDTRKLNYRYNPETIQLSISVVLVFFAWFFILPSNVCSYAYILAETFRIPASLFISLSNGAGQLGLLVGGVFAIFFKKSNKLLLTLLSILNLFNVLILVVPPQLGIILMISQYLMLGMYVSLATYLFFMNSLHLKRYVFTGTILASIVFVTAFFKNSSEGVTASTVFTMNLLISFVVLVFVILLNLVKAQPQKFIPVLNPGRPVLGAFLLLCAYTFILSFSLGYLSNESELILPNTGELSSILNVIPYVGTMLLVLSLPKRKFHMGVITYIANALMIISIAYVDFFSDQTAMSGLINVLLYFAIAINQLFIFDTTMVLSEKAIIPSIPISVGLLTFVLGSAFGDHVGELILIDRIATIDRLLITLIALASTISPLLRIMLSKHSTTSIFRINPVSLANLPAAEITEHTVETETALQYDDTKIYPQIANYNTLTNREKEVLDLLIKGYPSEVICTTLFISINTLKRHVQNIYNKLGVHNRAELFKLLHKK